MRLWKFLQLEDFEDDSPNRMPLKKSAFEVYDMRSAFVSMDQAFDYVGDNSSYQKRITTILSLQWLFYSFFVMGMPVLLETPNFYCNDTVCSEQQICSTDIQFTTGGFNSITKEFELFCNKKYLIGYAASVFFLGQSLGGIIFPILANAFGRKRVMLFGLLTGSLSIIICGFCYDINMLYGLFFSAGFGLSGHETIVYVYITEISANRFRSISNNVLATVWAAAMIVFSWWVMLFKSWRSLMILGIGLPLAIGALLMMVFFVESPRWLNSQRYFDECRRVLRFVSVYNRRKPFDFNFIDEMERFNHKALKLNISSDNMQSMLAAPQKKPPSAISSYFDLCRHRKLTKITGILMLCWFLRYFAYYGIQFSMETFGAQIQYTLMLTSLAEVMAALISAFIKVRTRRLPSLQISLLMITGCCVFFFFIRVPKMCEDQICIVQKGFTLGMAFVNHKKYHKILKFATTFYMTTLNTYTGEVYPTTVRTNGYGVCMTFGQIGSSVVPIYVQYIIQSEIAINPLFNVSFISILVLLLTKFLPETLNRMSDDPTADFNPSQKQETEMMPYSQTDLNSYWLLERQKQDQVDSNLHGY